MIPGPMWKMPYNDLFLIYIYIKIHIFLYKKYIFFYIDDKAKMIRGHIIPLNFPYHTPKLSCNPEHNVADTPVGRPHHVLNVYNENRNFLQTINKSVYIF